MATPQLIQRAAPGASSKWPLWHMAVAFVLPISALAKADFGGTLFGQDMLAVLVLPLLIARRGSYEKLQRVGSFYVFAAIWFLGQIVTDLIVDTRWDEIVRGWSMILFFALHFTVLWLLLTRSWLTMLAYAVGEAAYMIVGTRYLDSPFDAYPWKFGLGLGIALIAAIAGSWMGMERKRWAWWLAPTLMFVTAGLLLANDARSLFGTVTMAGLYVTFVLWVRARPRLAAAIGPRTFSALLLGGLLASQALIMVYGAVAASGLAGEDAREKYQSQTAGDLNLIQSGRTETLVSLVAIGDSPIIGHGSWARDVSYVRLLQRELTKAGIKSQVYTNDDIIPTHSHILGAWVNAGILGAVFWSWALFVCFSALFWVLKSERMPLPLVALIGCVFLWDVPFSPFGANMRFNDAFALVLLCAVRVNAKRLVMAGQRAMPKPGWHTRTVVVPT